MTDEKQRENSGKQNKFNQQNKQAEERKASETAGQREPIQEPATEKTAQSETAAQKK